MTAGNRHGGTPPDWLQGPIAPPPIRGPLPGVSAEAICRRALTIVDAEGADALTARRLAADLRISTRTLYDRVGSMECVLRSVARLYLITVEAAMREHAPGESATLSRCIELHDVLIRHPHLTSLLANADVPVPVGIAERLEASDVPAGASRDLRTRCGRSLVNVVVGDAVSAVRAGRDHPDVEVFRDTVGWIIAGVRAQSGGVGAT
jgi:AcrR family transcriptional regulator